MYTAPATAGITRKVIIQNFIISLDEEVNGKGRLRKKTKGVQALVLFLGKVIKCKNGIFVRLNGVIKNSDFMIVVVGKFFVLQLRPGKN